MAFTYSFGFLELHNSNHSAIGEPTSDQIDIPSVLSIQFTSKGLLLYQKDAGVRFIPENRQNTLGTGVIDLRASLNGNYPSRPLSAIRWLVIHHTGADANSTPEEIDAYHKSLGWPGCGYHMVVRQDGTAYYVGDVQTKRANVYGLNGVVVGIVLTGDFTTVPPSPAQLAGAKLAVEFARREIGHPVEVTGHRDIALPESPTSCPGDTWEEYKHLLF